MWPFFCFGWERCGRMAVRDPEGLLNFCADNSRKRNSRSPKSHASSFPDASHFESSGGNALHENHKAKESWGAGAMGWLGFSKGRKEKPSWDLMRARRAATFWR